MASLEESAGDRWLRTADIGRPCAGFRRLKPVSPCRDKLLIIGGTGFSLRSLESLPRQWGRPQTTQTTKGDRLRHKAAIQYCLASSLLNQFADYLPRSDLAEEALEDSPSTCTGPASAGYFREWSVSA